MPVPSEASASSRPPHLGGARARPRWRAALASLLRLRRPEVDEAEEVSRAAVEALVGVPVGDLGLYVQALRHRSLLRGQTDGHLASNERLEFLGDAVLGAAVAERLYGEFPDKNEGFLTRVRARLVNGEMLADFARALDLGPLILMSDNMADSDGRDNTTILADAFEAIVGAVYLDLGFQSARRFVFRVLDRCVMLEEVAEQRSNYKSLLLEFVQARGWAQPTYAVVNEEGPSHNRQFTINAEVDGRALGQGRAASKKKAEQQAAQAALRRLQEEEA